MIKFNDGSDCPDIEEYFEQMEADIKALRNRVDEEREIADYWFKKYMELKKE